MSNFLNNTNDLQKIYNEVNGIGDLITQISNALTGKAGPENDVVVSSIATTTASPSITIPDAVGKANIALIYMSSGGYQESAMADAGLGSVIVNGESHSYTIMYTSELYTDSNDGFIKYNSTTGTISLSPNRYNETFIAGNYMYVTWGSSGGGNTSSTPTLISFTIDETAYQAEEGMTWGEWVESDYNTFDGTLTPSEEEVHFEYSDFMGIIVDDSFTSIGGTDIIINNHNYGTYLILD